MKTELWSYCHTCSRLRKLTEDVLVFMKNHFLFPSGFFVFLSCIPLLWLYEYIHQQWNRGMLRLRNKRAPQSWSELQAGSQTASVSAPWCQFPYFICLPCAFPANTLLCFHPPLFGFFLHLLFLCVPHHIRWWLFISRWWAFIFASTEHTLLEEKLISP